MSIEFSSYLKRIGNTFGAEVPLEVSSHFGKKGHVPIKGTVNGAEFKSSLIPKGNSTHIIYVNSIIRRKLNLQEGDDLDFKIEFHKEYYNYPVPEDLKEALEAIPEAEEAFKKRNNSVKFWMIEYINASKKKETRDNRIVKVIDILLRKTPV